MHASVSNLEQQVFTQKAFIEKMAKKIEAQASQHRAEMQKQMAAAVQELKEREQRVNAKSDSADCSVPMDTVDS